MPNLGPCSWAGSRVGLVEKHLLVNGDQTLGVGLWRWTEPSAWSVTLQSFLLSWDILLRTAELRTPALSGPPQPVGIWAGIKLLCPGQKLGLWDP